MRQQLIDWQQRELSISTQAQRLGLSRSGLYYQPVPPSAQEVALKHRIYDIFTERLWRTVNYEDLYKSAAPLPLSLS